MAEGRSSIATLYVGDSVKEGNIRQGEIVEALRQQGMTIRETKHGSREDRIDKIDGYLTVNDVAIKYYPDLKEDLGKEIPVQIKDREKLYKDLLFEARSDRDEKGASGRDYKSKAKYFFCRPAGSKIHCGRIATLRSIADAGVEKHSKAMSTDKTSVFASAKYPGVEIRRHWDKRDFYWKVLLFVPNKVLKDIK